MEVPLILLIFLCKSFTNKNPVRIFSFVKRLSFIQFHLCYLIFKCRPYNVNDKALIIGDAAHAVVPFYGQGMNAGFEDCSILDELFQKHHDNVANIFKEFSETRWKDCFAISDLAMYNYIEVRLLEKVAVNKRRFLGYIRELIHWAFPIKNIVSSRSFSISFLFDNSSCNISLRGGQASISPYHHNPLIF